MFHAPLHLTSLHSTRECWWTIERERIGNRNGYISISVVLARGNRLDLVVSEKSIVLFWAVLKWVSGSTQSDRYGDVSVSVADQFPAR